MVLKTSPVMKKVVNKEYLKSYLYGVEVKLADKIMSSVLERKPKVIVMKEVKKDIQLLSVLSDVDKNQMWLWAVKFYRHCIAGAARKKEMDDRAEMLYTVLRNESVQLEHLKNELVDSIEYQKKHSDLVRILSDEENKFFYCTVLSDPAPDHAAYQGKIYYKRNATYSDEEQLFIDTQGLMSVDEVVLVRPWLTTRRNCRHRFIPVSFKDAQTGDYRDFRKSHEITYEEGQYRTYRDRYKMMAKFKKSFVDKGVKVPDQLKADIKRTRLLVKKWYRAWKGS